MSNWNTYFTQDFFDLLLNNKRIDELNLSGNYVREGFGIQLGFSNLKKINLSNTGIPLDIMKNIEENLKFKI